MKIKKVFKIIFLVIICLIILFIPALFIYSGITAKAMDNYLKKIPSDCNHIPAYTLPLKGILYYNNDDIDMPEREIVLLIFNNAAITFHSVDIDDNYMMWELYSANLSDKNEKLLCKGKMKIEGGRKIQNNFDLDYSQRNAFYYNEKVVITDFETLFEYDLINDALKEYKYAEYDFPTVGMSHTFTDDKTICFEKDGVKKSISLFDMENSGESLKKIYELNDDSISKFFSNKESFSEFFSNKLVMYVEDKVYIIGRLLTSMGESFGILMNYDFESNKLSYLDYRYFSDIIYYDDFYCLNVV